jgi:acyl carrier protein phosphodiesterase
MRVTIRTRLNGRLPDPQGKYRDEITQEVTIEQEEELIEDVEAKMKEIRTKFYAELKRMGGHNYEV